MQPKESAWERGRKEPTLSTFCLCIANSNTAECGHQPPWNPYKENKPAPPTLLFYSNTNLWSELFVTVPLPHLLHILNCATWECDWGGNVWLHLEAATTWYLWLRVEKLIVCIKLLLLFTKFSSLTASGGQEGDQFSACKRGQWWDSYTRKHPLLGFHGSTTGCMSAVLQMCSNRWPETLYCHHAQKGQSSSSSLWALERSSSSAKAGEHLRTTVPRDIWPSSWWF